MILNNNTDLQESQKNRMYEYLWLTYFNDTLYNKKLITKEQYNKMMLKIKSVQ